MDFDPHQQPKIQEHNDYSKVTTFLLDYYVYIHFRCCIAIILCGLFFPHGRGKDHIPLRDTETAGSEDRIHCRVPHTKNMYMVQCCRAISASESNNPAYNNDHASHPDPSKYKFKYLFCPPQARKIY